MEEYVLTAIQLGLPSITFLEHLECGIIYDHRTWLTADHFDCYFREGQRLKKKFSSSIEIRLGTELGYNPFAVNELQTMLDSFPFEHIGLSYHFFFDGTRHCNVVSRRSENITALRDVGIERVLDGYFSGLLDAVSLLPCDKICHLDAVLRHLPGLRLAPQHHGQIVKLLDYISRKGIALEVNTSGYDLRSYPYPMEQIINQARRKNIQLIAGSDAHRPEQIGRYFDRLSF